MKSQSRKGHRETGRPARVRVALECDVLEVARGMLANAGSPAESDSDTVVALFTIGLGVLSGHCNEFLATKLRNAHLKAFGPDGPARFREAALELHGAMTMPELGTALLDGGKPGSARGPRIQ